MGHAEDAGDVGGEYGVGEPVFGLDDLGDFAGEHDEWLSAGSYDLADVIEHEAADAIVLESAGGRRV
ncbi:MAG: hypothetical protein ACRCYQ_16565 [Nocardioides sp.]